MSGALNGMRVVVIGASSGMGRESAALFAREKARVMAAARRKDRLAGLREEMAAEGREIETFAADTREASQMAALARRAKERFGGIDTLVYATGTNTPDRALTRLNPAVWNDLIATNLTGAYYAADAVLPIMREQKSGLLIFVSSMSAYIPDVSGAAYQASKRGLHGLAHAIRFEERANGIRATIVAPGFTDTEIMRHRPVQPTVEQLAKALRPEDVAQMVLAIAQLPARVYVPEVQMQPAES
jgi:NADP-dependent 3-hydroxy acid dehydrogenase YdfG